MPLPEAKNLNQIKDICNFCGCKIELLEQQIERNKRFLGMVIHDMRNPTVAIKLGLENTQVNLTDALQLLQDEQVEFHSRSADLLQLLSESQLHEAESLKMAKKVQSQLDQMQSKIKWLQNLL